MDEKTIQPIPKIYAAINQIACALAAPKDKTNSFGKYKYRDLPTLRNALKPLLLKFGVFILPTSTKVTENNRDVITMTVRCISTEDGSEVSSQLCVNADDHKGMSAEQASGSALTYAEKYLLCMLFHVDDDSDAIDPEDDSVQRKDKDKYIDELNKAINDIQGATSMQDLVKRNAKYPKFHTDQAYIDAGSIVKEKFM